MRTCECGHKHCCHRHVLKEVITTKNESGMTYRFSGKICPESGCNAFLGDTLLSGPESEHRG